MNVEEVLMRTMISTGRFKSRYESAIADNSLLSQGIEDLQCSTTINCFYNTSKEYQVYKFLFEIYRDEVQSSLKSLDNLLQVFTKVISRELGLHTSFEFDVVKLRNIISCAHFRNNRLVISNRNINKDFEIVAKFISATKKLNEFHIYFSNNSEKFEMLKSQFNEISNCWSIKEQKRKRPGLKNIQIENALNKIEIYYERRCSIKNPSIILSNFEKAVDYIGEKLNISGSLVAPFSSIGVGKNGIYALEEHGLKYFLVSVGAITILKTTDLKEAIICFCNFNVVARHLIITSKFRQFFQLICHLADMPMYAKKSRGRVFELPKRLAEDICDIIENTMNE